MKELGKITDVFQLYELGKAYNTRIKLQAETNRNTNFYNSKQWLGVKSNGLDTPVFNFLKRGIDFFIAFVMSKDIKINFTPELINDVNPNDDEQEVLTLAQMVSDHIVDIWEKNKMNTMYRGVLLDSANGGDGCIYSFWNDAIDLGLPKMDDVLLKDNITGDIENQRIDNVNVYFGNPNDTRVNHRGRPVQPYIIIAFRQLVKDTIEEAKKKDDNGKMYGEPDKIVADQDYEEQIGQYGKIELEGTHDETAKCTVLLKLYPKDGTIHAVKSGKFGYVRKEWNTKLTLYPVSWMNWSERKNSYHGQAVATAIIPNQIFINKSFAMLMLWVKKMAIPPVVFDHSRIGNWSNVVGRAIPVDGDINNVAQNLSPSQISNGVFKFLDNVIQYTKECLGMPDVLLGQIKNPENTSAIITTTKQAGIPLENVEANVYQMVEDWGYIQLDFMANYYGNRYVNLKRDGKNIVKLIDFDKLKEYKFRLKLDVGPSSYYSEENAMSALDNLLNLEKITFLQYLEHYPKGHIPDQEKLIEEIKMQASQEQNTEMMQQFIQSLPSEEQQRLAELPDEQFQQEVMAMMGQEQPIQ